MTYQEIDFETNCVKVSTFLRRLGKKYPKFSEVWGEFIEDCILNYMPTTRTPHYYNELVEDNFVIGIDMETEGHFYVWFQARCKEQVIDGEGTIYNVSENTEPAETTENAEPVDYTKMSDNELHDVVLSQLDYINRDLMETCVYNDLNGNGKYVRVGVNEFMDVTPALTEFNSRFGITEIFCMIYRHYESRKTHVEYDSFDDTMYIVEVIPYDDDGNIIEYGYYVGDYYVRYQGITENIEIVEVEENETENTNETKNEKEVKKSMEKSNRNFKLNGVNYTVVNNPNYNKNYSYEPTCQKYYAMKLLSTDSITKSWVKTGITGNTIERVKEKVTEWEDFNQYVNNYDNTKTAQVTNKIYYKSVTNDREKGYSKIFHTGEIYELKDLKNNTVVYGECVRVNYKTVDFVIDGVKSRLKVIKGTTQYSASSKKYDVFSTHIVEPVEPAEPDTPVKDNNNLSLSDTAKTHIRNAYNYVIGELINGLCDNKPVSNEYKECFNMLHGGEKLVNYIYNECMENGFDVGWCGLGQAPAEIKKYDSWLIKNHIRNMLELDNIFSLPADNDTVANEIYNIPAIKMNSIIDLIEQCNSTMEKTMLLDYVSFETGVSYDAIKQIYDVYIKETFLDDDETTFDSVLEEIYSTGCVVGIDDDTVKDFKRILGDDEIPF